MDETANSKRTNELQEPEIKFPEPGASSGTSITTPNNPVDQAADFLPRALTAIKVNFKEAVFLSLMVGYVFIAAFGHMQTMQNYLGFFAVLLIGIIFYAIWEKITLKDILYLVLIILLSAYILCFKFNLLNI